MKNATVWFMGLPCSGKTTLAQLLNRNPQTIHLDGDVLRNTLCADLTYTHLDRLENLRRAACVAQLLNDNGFNVTASFITPTEDTREMVRSIVKNLILVYVECPIDVCTRRDVKKMYKKAYDGLIEDFTGVSAPFQHPKDADIVVNTDKMSRWDCIRVLEEEIPKYWKIPLPESNHEEVSKGS